MGLRVRRRAIERRTRLLGSISAAGWAFEVVLYLLWSWAFKVTSHEREIPLCPFLYGGAPLDHLGTRQHGCTGSPGLLSRWKLEEPHLDRRLQSADPRRHGAAVRPGGRAHAADGVRTGGLRPEHLRGQPRPGHVRL